MNIFSYSALFLVAGALILAPAQGNTVHAQNSQIMNGETLGLILADWGPCPAQAQNSTAATSCESDLNGDGQVDQLDVDLLLSQWTNKPRAKGNKNPDINGDGVVDGADLGMILAAWGTCQNDIPTSCAEDLNSDTLIGKADQSIVMAAWNSQEKPTFTDRDRARLRAAAALRTEGSTLVRPTANGSTQNTLQLRERTVRRDLMQQYFNGIVGRLTAGIARLEGISSRIESRVEILRSSGKDVSVSVQALAQANTHLAEARASLASLPKNISATTNTAPNVIAMTTESFAKVRATVAEIKSDLQTAQDYLTRAVSSLRSL